MRKSIVIPTYWARNSGEPWREGDAVYDHPTPVDQEGTLARTLESMKILNDKTFKLVILICPTTPDVAEAAYHKVVQIVERVKLNAETYLFTMSALAEMRQLLLKAGLDQQDLRLLSLSGYSNVRNMCLLASSILTSDASILIDDDEVFELPDYVSRAVEFLGHRAYGDVVHGIAGYYLNKSGRYYDDVKIAPWMTYWNRFDCKARAFDKFIGSGARIKRTPFAFGGAMTIHRDLFECVPFDPHVTRGEDIDYLINARMFGFSFFLDNTLSIKHLPEPKSHPEWMRVREDIYRFIYQRAKLNSQYEDGSMVMVKADDLLPYPGEFLKDDLEEKIYHSNMMLSAQYLAEGDAEASQEAQRNIYIAYHEALPQFDAFSAYVATQKSWERLMNMVQKERYGLRAILERDNLSAPKIKRSDTKHRELTQRELIQALSKAPYIGQLSQGELETLCDYCYVKTFFENETVFSRGGFNDATCFVLKGRIQLLTSGDGPDADPIVIGEIRKGELFGEASIAHKTNRLNGTAVEFTELLCIHKSSMNQIIAQHPALGNRLLIIFLTSISGKLFKANEALREKELFLARKTDEAMFKKP